MLNGKTSVGSVSMEALHRNTLNVNAERENKRVLRLKRAHDILKSCIRPTLSNASELIMYFEELDRQSVLNEVDEDLQCAVLMPFLTPRARLF
jgi:hypothetical protein